METVRRFVFATPLVAVLAAAAAAPAGAAAPQIVTVSGTVGCEAPASAADAALPNIVRLFTVDGTILGDAVPDDHGAVRFAARVPAGYAGTLVVVGRFHGCAIVRTAQFGGTATPPFAYSHYDLTAGANPHLVNRFNSSVTTARMFDNSGISPNLADGPDFALIAKEHADIQRSDPAHAP